MNMHAAVSARISVVTISDIHPVPQQYCVSSMNSLCTLNINTNRKSLTRLILSNLANSALALTKGYVNQLDKCHG